MIIGVFYFRVCNLVYNLCVSKEFKLRKCFDGN